MYMVKIQAPAGGKEGEARCMREVGNNSKQLGLIQQLPCLFFCDFIEILA